MIVIVFFSCFFFSPKKGKTKKINKNNNIVLLLFFLPSLYEWGKGIIRKVKKKKKKDCHSFFNNNHLYIFIDSETSSIYINKFQIKIIKSRVSKICYLSFIFIFIWFSSFKDATTEKMEACFITFLSFLWKKIVSHIHIKQYNKK